MKFIDRKREITSLCDWCSRFRGSVLYVYGPEGCGKSMLLKEFVKSYNKYFGDSSFAIYINAIEFGSIEEAVYCSNPKDITRSIIAKNIASMLGYGSVDNVFDRFSRRILESRNVLFVFDNLVDAIGLSKVELYIKWLYELLWKLADECKDLIINFIILTSECESLRYIYRHKYAHARMIWNFDKKDFRELFHVLEPPNNIDFENIWNLLGGNPGKLIELAYIFQWDVKEMLDYYKKNIMLTIRKILLKGLRDELCKVIEDIDNLGKEPTKKMGKLEKLLMKHNLVIRLGPSLDLRPLYKVPELGIGTYYAWQIPMYKTIIEELLRELNVR